MIYFLNRKEKVESEGKKEQNHIWEWKMKGEKKKSEGRTTK